MKLESLLPPATRGQNRVAVVVTTDLSVGDSVELINKNKNLGTFKVAGIHPMKLGDITHKDLVGFVHADPTLFWNRLEGVIGCGQPAETIITFVTVGTDWLAEAEIMEEEEELVVIEPPRRKKNYRNDEDEE